MPCSWLCLSLSAGSKSKWEAARCAYLSVYGLPHPPGPKKGGKGKAIQLLSSPRDLDREGMGEQGEHSWRKVKSVLLPGRPCAAASTAGVGGDERAREPLLWAAAYRASLCCLMQSKGGWCPKSPLLTCTEDACEHRWLPVSVARAEQPNRRAPCPAGVAL